MTPRSWLSVARHAWLAAAAFAIGGAGNAQGAAADAKGAAAAPVAAPVAAITPATGPAAKAATKPPENPLPKPRRLPDGHPNWTGFWTPVGGLLDRNFGPGAKAPPPAPATANGAQSRIQPLAELRSPYKEKYQALLDAAARGQPTPDPTALCLPPGMPRMMRATYGVEILQTPGQVTMTSEWQAASRRIWTDGRRHPDPEDLLPSYAGDSIGHWEGDTLVVNTVGVRTDVLLDQSGLPISKKLVITERIHETPDHLLQDEITIDDADVFTAPWQLVFRYRYRPELSLQEYVCLENNRNVGPEGQPKFD
jgi:hypothetical protein